VAYALEVCFLDDHVQNGRTPQHHYRGKALPVIVAECWTCLEAQCDCRGDGSRMLDDLSGEPCAHPPVPCPLTAGQDDDCRALSHDVRPVAEIVRPTDEV
jgi:hypothetical protein